MKKLLFVVALAVFAASLPAQAQQCDRGCPCGNTCIDCDDTCRVGNGSANGSGGRDPDQTALVVVGVVSLVVFVAGIGLIIWSLTQTSGPQGPRVLPAADEPSPSTSPPSHKSDSPIADDDLDF